jgi:hypothetical protein
MHLSPITLPLEENDVNKTELDKETVLEGGRSSSRVVVP